MSELARPDGGSCLPESPSKSLWSARNGVRRHAVSTASAWAQAKGEAGSRAEHLRLAPVQSHHRLGVTQNPPSTAPSATALCLAPARLRLGPIVASHVYCDAECCRHCPTAFNGPRPSLSTPSILNATLPHAKTALRRKWRNNVHGCHCSFGEKLAQILKYHGEIWCKISRLRPGENHYTGN